MFIKKIIFIIFTSLTLIFLSSLISGVEASISLTLMPGPPNNTLSLGNFTPGEAKYFQPSGAGIIATVFSTSNFELRIKNNNPVPKALYLQNNDQYYIECTESNRNFAYQATKNTETPAGSGVMVNQTAALIPQIERVVYRGVANGGVQINFNFDLKVPFKINNVVTPTGRYVAQIVVSAVEI